MTLAIELQLKEIGRAQTAFVRGPSSTPVSVNSIRRDQIASLPDNQSLNRVIQTVPGIVRFSYNEPVAHGFHGLTYELDGVPLPQGTTSNFSEVIDPRSIDSLEVFTGAFPAEFGGSRQGAVVNILSHRANDLTAPEEGSLTAGVGTYGSAQSVALGIDPRRNDPHLLQCQRRADQSRARLTDLRSRSRRLESIQPIPALDHEHRRARHAGLRLLEQLRVVSDSDQHDVQSERSRRRTAAHGRRAARIRSLHQSRLHQ